MSTTQTNEWLTKHAFRVVTLWFILRKYSLENRVGTSYGAVMQLSQTHSKFNYVKFFKTEKDIIFFLYVILV